jgi:hypothetical protein
MITKLKRRTESRAFRELEARVVQTSKEISKVLKRTDKLKKALNNIEMKLDADSI